MIDIPYIDWGAPEREAKVALAATRHYVECPGMARLYGAFASAGLSCDECGRFQMRCCRCRKESEGHKCHRYPVVYTDGACSNNGYPLACSGVGYALGTDEDDQYSIPITEEVDPGRSRTSQRAELLAALYGLLALEENEQEKSNDDPQKKPRRGRGKKSHALEEDRSLWIVASDSEYLVKGMADLVSKWKLRNWKTSTGKDPVNLDLFKNLDRNILRIEEIFNIRIKFFWVPREYNSVADQLAKDAAAKALPRPATNVADAHLHSASPFPLRRASAQPPSSHSHDQQIRFQV